MYFVWPLTCFNLSLHPCCHGFQRKFTRRGRKGKVSCTRHHKGCTTHQFTVHKSWHIFHACMASVSSWTGAKQDIQLVFQWSMYMVTVSYLTGAKLDIQLILQWNMCMASITPYHAAGPIKRNIGIQWNTIPNSQPCLNLHISMSV